MFISGKSQEEKAAPCRIATNPSCHSTCFVIYHHQYSELIPMAHETAFLAPNSVLGQYWTKRRYFDYLIEKDNFRLLDGKKLRLLVYLDPAIANGPEAVRRNVEEDTRATQFLMRHMCDIRPELTVYITTCDMLTPGADENTPVLESSKDPYIQNRINLYTELNRQFGRVLNVHLTEIARPDADYCPLLHAVKNPPAGKKTLSFAPLEYHQLYFPERILGDVEKCIPLGIPAIIPAMPPLTTMEIIQALNPALLNRLPDPAPEDPAGAHFTSIHSFQWLDPKDGYLVTKDDQLALLNFFYGVDAI